MTWAVPLPAAIRGLGRTYFGAAGDIPVSGDYDYTDVGIFRRATGFWAVKDVTKFYFGVSDDLPVPGDYDGNSLSDPRHLPPFHGPVGNPEHQLSLLWWGR